MKLSKLQMETVEYCKHQIDDARLKGNNVEAQNGIVLSPGGKCTIRTLKALEKKGLLEVVEDNSGIGTSFGAFPSKVKILNY